MATPRIVISPGINVSRESTLTVESFTTEVKEATAKATAEGWAKPKLESVLNELIRKYWKVLPKELRGSVTKGIIQMAQADYFVLTQNMKTLNRALLENFSPEAIKALISDNPAVVITKDSIRGMEFVNAKGNPFIKDYYKQVKSELRAMAANPPVFQETKDGEPRKLSLRNLAEMKTRYEAGQEDVAKLKNEGVKLVWTSSHADASARCQPYQGKLYSLDGTSGTTEDGIRYTPLEEAEAGPKGDGNGIITGYNCRHFLIEYQPGSKAPSHFDEKNVQRERTITSQQRAYENTIRHSKMAQRIAKSVGDKAEARRLASVIQRQTENYIAYSTSNGRPYYQWRTQVTREESDMGEL